MITEATLSSLRARIAIATDPRQWDESREILMRAKEQLQQDPHLAHAVMECAIRSDSAEADFDNMMRNQIAIDCIRMVLPRYANKTLRGAGSRNTTPEQNAQLEHDYYTGLEKLVSAVPESRRWREIVWYFGLSQHPMAGHGAIFKWAAKSSDALGGAMRYHPPILPGAKDVRRKALDAAYVGDIAYATACAVTDDPLELYAFMRALRCDEKIQPLPDLRPY